MNWYRNSNGRIENESPVIIDIEGNYDFPPIISRCIRASSGSLKCHFKFIENDIKIQIKIERAIRKLEIERIKKVKGEKL